jgi:hypothetical protein
VRRAKALGGTPKRARRGGLGMSDGAALTDVQRKRYATHCPPRLPAPVHPVHLHRCEILYRLIDL